MKFTSLVWWTTTALLLGLGSSVANGFEETMETAKDTLESASPGSSAHGHVRRNSNVNGGHNGHGRNLLFLKKKSVTIDSPLNGAVIAASNDGSKMDVVVSFNSGGLFNKLSTIDLLMDSKVVATKQSASANGKESFSVDLKGVASGLHQLQARGSAGASLFPNLRRGRSVQSKVVSVTINTTSPIAPNASPNDPNVPTVAAPKAPSATDPSTPMAPKVSPVKPPVKAPTRPIVVSPINATACGLNQSFLYFSGHNEAISTEKGVVNVTWIPAFVFGLDDVNFLWCGKLSYDVFVVQGETNFTDLNATIPELVERSKLSTSGGMKHIETSALSLAVRDLAPGLNYSILVTAKTASGHFSFNREQAVVTVATTSPVIKSNFTRMIVIPESNGTFQLKKVDGQNAVVFSGNLPDEALSVKPLDFVYFFDSDGNATMGQFLTKTNGAAGQVTWAYRPADLSDVFDELDMSADVANQDLSALQINGDNVDAENALSNAEYDALDMNVKVNLCIAYGVDAATCLEELNGRRLFLGGLIKVTKSILKAIAGFFKREADYVADVIKGVAKTNGSGIGALNKAIVAELDKGIRGRRNLAVMDDQSSAKLTSGNALEVGAKFDASTRGRVRITVSVLRSLHAASILLWGELGIKGYLLTNDRIQADIRPDVLKIFQKSLYNEFRVGPVPIVITNRLSAYAFVELSLEADGQALVPLAASFDYDFAFYYDRKQSPSFEKTTNIERRARPLLDPVINVRMNALAELGMTFGWDVHLHEILQASVAVDLGVTATLDVGANIESLAITTPYYYTLNELEITAFVRARLLLGLYTNLRRLIHIGLGTSSNVPFNFRNATYRFPSPNWVRSGATLTAPLQKALAKARADPNLQTATSITSTQLNALEPDPYNGFRGTIKGMDRSFGSAWSVFRENYKIAILPTIKVELAGSPYFCTGNDAVTIKIEATASNKIAVEDSAMWFADFDGVMLKEDSKGWVISSDRSLFDSATLSLPRSALQNFSMYEPPSVLGEVYLRATPRLMSFPRNSLSAKDRILWGGFSLEPFECCDDADCVYLKKKNLAGKGVCSSRMCNLGLGQRFVPSPNEFRKFDPPIVLTVNFTSTGSNLGIEYFDVYRGNANLQPVGSALVSLRDTGSGKGDDTIAGDAIFSNVYELQPTDIFKDEKFTLLAVPVIASLPDFRSRYNMLTQVLYLKYIIK